MKEVFLVDERLRDSSYKNIFYGTGTLSIIRLKDILSAGIRIDYIADYDENKWGTTVCERAIISHEELCAMEKKNVIIGSLVYKNEIYTRLMKMGILSEEIYFDNLSGAMNDSVELAK